MWKEGRAVKRQNAHPNKAVLCLFTYPSSKIFVSGATDGTAIIWHFSASLIIQKIEEFSTYTGKDANPPPKFQIQSVCLSKQSLIIGNRAGEILRFPFSVSGAKQKAPLGELQSSLLLASFHHERINSISFSTSSKRLYLMTEAEGEYGTFAVINVTDSLKVFEEKVEFKYPLVRMLACKLSPRIFLVLKGGVTVYNYTSDLKDERNSRLQRRKEWMKCESGIKAAILSSRENYLAVLIAPSSLQNAKIEIYNLNSPDAQFYQLYKVEENIPASIEVIDFCVDHDYLVYQSPDEEQTIIDMLTCEKVKAGSVENNLEWNEDAKKTSPSVRDISIFYSEENRLMKVVQAMNTSIIASD